MQFWQCPLLLMVSLIAAINTQQTPSQRLEPNQVAGFVQLHKQLEQQKEQHQQQPEQPAQADNKDYAPSPAVLLQLTPGDWKNVQDKRNWNRMQGMWGKRSQQQPSDESALSEITPPRMVKRAWSDLSQQGWGKRSWTQLHGVWGKRRWDQLHGAWGKRTPSELDDKQDHQENSQEEEDQSTETEREDANDSDDLENNKRSGWNKMQGVWGKRSSTPAAMEGIGNNDLLLLISGTGDQLYQQNDDQVATGKLNGKLNVEDAGSEESVDKRGWNQMQGVWGKRALSAMAAGYKRNWNNLRGAWGKREIPAAIAKGMEWSRKRESGWNNLKGLWG